MTTVQMRKGKKKKKKKTQKLAYLANSTPCFSSGPTSYQHDLQSLQMASRDQDPEPGSPKDGANVAMAFGGFSKAKVGVS